MNVTMEDIATTVTLEPRYTWERDEWTDYDMTIVSRGRTYPIGTLTVYDDASRGVLALRHYDMRTKAQWAAWNAITDLFGMARPETWQTPYAMAPGLSY